MNHRSNLTTVAATLAAATLLCTLSAAADTAWKWREGVGTSITNAADYFDAANWTNGVMEDASTTALFPETLTTYRYVKADRALSIGRLRGANLGGGVDSYTSTSAGHASAGQRCSRTCSRYSFRK